MCVRQHGARLGCVARWVVWWALDGTLIRWASSIMMYSQVNFARLAFSLIATSYEQTTTSNSPYTRSRSRINALSGPKPIIGPSESGTHRDKCPPKLGGSRTTHAPLVLRAVELDRAKPRAPLLELAAPVPERRFGHHHDVRPLPVLVVVQEAEQAAGPG
eukprot:SAG22_NODE_119_length_19257_cov_43.260413_10_plen_160_part_00